MCRICNVVNCIRRNLFCCGNSNYSNSNYRNSDCNNYRYSEPRTNVICANQRNSGFTPCCDDDSTRCHKHHHDCGSNYDYDCGCDH